MAGSVPRSLTTFRDRPIKQKLTAIIVLTTAAALLLTGIGIVLSDAVIFRGNLYRDLDSLAQIVSDNVAASLAFDDPRSAGETLAALHARRRLVSACLFRANGDLFASYLRSASARPCPAPSAEPEFKFLTRYVFLSHPIFLSGRRIGTLVMLSDFGQIYERIELYGSTVLGVLLVSSLFALLLSARLQAVIVDPISELAAAALSVSKSKDYSVRVRKPSRDEVGTLVDAFNEMLSAIQARDNNLNLALSEREDALRDLRRSNERLARSNDDLERFAFVASHDLQEPLRMISIYSQLLVKLHGNALGQQANEYVDNIVGGTQRMRELLGDLLEYAELGARRDEPLQSVDLNQVLGKAVENLKVAIDDNSAIITSDSLPNLQVFEGHFVPLFQNLIGNAIKYRSATPPRIHISVQQTDHQCRFSVADNGIGIAPEYHQKIFVPFKRLHGKKIAGTGIGLAICQRVVERYGGRIWVESTGHEGSVFIFDLPDTLISQEEEPE